MTMARKRKSDLEIYADELDEITEEKLKKKYNFPEDKPIEKKHRMNIKKEETLATLYPDAADASLGRLRNNPELDVENGTWVLITKYIPVSKECRPVRWGVYWGLPISEDGRDARGRTGCRVLHAKESVIVFQDEYIIPTEETLSALKEDGWFVKEIGAASSNPPTLEYIEKSRTLCEEEREIIMALQLDGLSEEQACTEYFGGRYADTANVSICYLPPEGKGEMLTDMFGNIGVRPFIAW